MANLYQRKKSKQFASLHKLKINQMKKTNVTKKEKQKYALKLKIDLDTFIRIKKLENKKLNKEDKKLLKFIKSQLEYNWRKPLIKELDKIEKKY